MNSTFAASAALAVAALLVSGCSSASNDAAAEVSTAVDVAATQDAQPPAESEAPVESEAVAPADFGDPATAACALLTDEEAQGFLEFEMTEAATGSSLPMQGTGNCTWSAADGLDLRTLQASLFRSEWIDEQMRENNPDVSARWFWDLNTTESTDPDGGTIEPLFDLTKPGPDGLGEASYFGPLGLCVLEGDDLYWCVSAGGLGADLENPEAVAIMEEMAALVDSRLNG